MRLIGEYEKHYGTIALFPFRNDIWRDDATHTQQYIIDLVNTIARYEPVILFCKTGLISRLYGIDKNVQVVECDYDDIWARDISPSFIIDGDSLRAIDWKFNAWGGRKEGSYYPWDADDRFASFVSWYLHLPCNRVDDIVLEGGGITTDGVDRLFATRSVLLNRNRNPFKKQVYVDQVIKNALGAKQVVWIPQGLALDETNGHIDNLLAFISPNKACLAWTDDKKSPNYMRVRKALEVLESQQDITIYKIPLPPDQYMRKEETSGLVYHDTAIPREEGGLLPASYINFYMVNDAVIIPAFDCDTDVVVKKQFEDIFPDRTVVQVNCRELLLGGGGIHCVLHEIPAINIKNTGVVKSVVTSKVEVRRGGIHETGMFAKEDIEPGEIVYIKGGHILKKSEVVSSSIINSYMPISDDYFIGAISLEEEESVKLYNNHSCDPNCGLNGEITFVAIKHIKTGEELTVDYAFIDNEDYRFVCNCGSPNCRHTVTGFDWRIKEIQDKYYPFFAPYLKEKIDTQRRKSLKRQ